ncbi:MULTISPECIES: Dabb family protein [Bacillus]|uniref:Dabb family protein n=1 Tax=Bacillus TaxID=1386 RepID=UPI0020CF5816|nr:Dabb family protein [Bacillus safensis]MCP9282871.1 Dabb family protein [Bacillus safensis]
MIRHLVLVKPNEKEYQKLIKNTLENKVLKLEEKVEGIVSTQIGSDFSERSKGYEFIFIIDFKDEQALHEWTDNKFHTPIRETLKKHSEMLVFDYYEGDFL